MDKYDDEAGKLSWFRCEEPATIAQIAAFGRQCAAEAYRDAAEMTGAEREKDFPDLRTLRDALDAKAASLRAGEGR